MVTIVLAQLGKMQVILIQMLVAVTAAQMERQEETGTLEVLVENQVSITAAVAVAVAADMEAVAAGEELVPREQMESAALALLA